MAVISSARFAQPYGGNFVVIETQCTHDGVADRRAPVSFLANVETLEIKDFSNVADGPAGDALIAYLRRSCGQDSRKGLIHAAITHARNARW